MMKTLMCACGKKAKYQKNLVFNKVQIDGWVCGSCGETYYNPEMAQQILVLNKLMKQTFQLTLSRIKSNLVLRIPKEVSDSLNLHKGEKIAFQLRSPKEMVLRPLEE